MSWLAPPEYWPEVILKDPKMDGFWYSTCPPIVLIGNLLGMDGLEEREREERSTRTSKGAHHQTKCTPPDKTVHHQAELYANTQKYLWDAPASQSFSTPSTLKDALSGPVSSMALFVLHR